MIGAPWRRRAWTAAAVLVGMLCAAYLVFWFPWAEALPALLAMDVALFAAGGTLAILLVWLLRTWRFVVLAGARGVRLPFGTAYLHTAAALGLAVITPLQAGEAMKLRLLAPLGARGMAALFLGERLADAAVLAVLTAVALGLAGLLPAPFAGLSLAGGVAGGALLLGLALLGDGAPAIARLPFAGAAGRGARLAVLAATLGCWVGTALLWWVTLAATGIRAGPALTVALTGSVTFANVLSAIPGGLGVSEVGAALFLVQAGVESGAAHAAALALRLQTLLVLAIALPHAGLLLRRP